jgi:hypothetical protein
MATKHFLTALSALALLSLAAPAAAQLRIEANLGRNVRIGADLPLPVVTVGGHRHHDRHHDHGRHHEAPRYRVVRERVWIPGHTRHVHVPAKYRWVRDACGHRTRVLVEPARTICIEEPGHYEWRERRVRCD